MKRIQTIGVDVPGTVHTGGTEIRISEWITDPINRITTVSLVRSDCRGYVVSPMLEVLASTIQMSAGVGDAGWAVIRVILVGLLLLYFPTTAVGGKRLQVGGGVEVSPRPQKIEEED
ncbi:hypothetical protein NE237_031784 [Protea cynaroides]|uniref:Uncharacterized protein n=1 Tax=Protea cynaroides TaxID=273540 RepID=A0A9Q0L1V2_9MAGN|nr:hypothetical protein NE237_031784 [Protea cynaroides]